MKKTFLTLVISVICINTIQAQFLKDIRMDYMNLSLGQNLGYLQVDEEDAKEEYIPFSTIDVEVVRFTKFPFVCAIETSNLFGLKDNSHLEHNFHSITANIGFVREYENNLTYKSGFSSVAVLLGGGYIAKSYQDIFSNPNKSRQPSGGLQILFRYLPAKFDNVYEPVYTKLILHIDKMDEGIFLYRIGINLCYDFSFLFRR